MPVEEPKDQLSGNEGIDDAFQDAPATQEATANSDDANVVADSHDDFGDLPFKSSKEVVAAYKELQKSYGDGRIELFELRKQYSELAPILKQLQENKGSSPKAADEDVAEALAELIKNGPTKTFDSYLQKNLGRLMEQQLADKMKKYDSAVSRVETLEKEKQVDKFLADYPQVTTQDEHMLIKIINDTPRIKSMPGVYDRLEAAMEKYIAKDPKGWASRSTTAAPDKSLASAKQAAGAIGGKAGGKGQSGPMDPFDEVLELDKKQNALWR